MTQTIEQAPGQFPYSVAHHALPLHAAREPFVVRNHQGRVAGQARLLWSFDDICSDLNVPRLIFNRAHRNGVIPRASIRRIDRGKLFYDGRQYLWLREFFGLVAESETLSGTGRFTRDELVRLLAVSQV